MGINKFSDLTAEEKKSTNPVTAMQNCSATALLTMHKPKINIQDYDIPASFDWRTKGVVSEIKD